MSRVVADLENREPGLRPKQDVGPTVRGKRGLELVFVVFAHETQRLTASRAPINVVGGAPLLGP